MTHSIESTFCRPHYEAGKSIADRLTPYLRIFLAFSSQARQWPRMNLYIELRWLQGQWWMRDYKSGYRFACFRHSIFVACTHVQYTESTFTGLYIYVLVIPRGICFGWSLANVNYSSYFLVLGAQVCGSWEIWHLPEYKCTFPIFGSIKYNNVAWIIDIFGWLVIRDVLT